MTVQRDEILDYVSYEEQRPALRASATAAKERRRVVVSDVLSFLFENDETVRYQVLEMVRAERHVREADIAHELATYNELLGRDGGLGCTLLIGLPDKDERDRLLRAWTDLPEHLFAELEGGERVAAVHDGRQVSDGKLSSVQFLQFPVGGRVPVALVCTHPDLDERVALTDDQRAALTEDLGAQTASRPAR